MTAATKARICLALLLLCGALSIKPVRVDFSMGLMQVLEGAEMAARGWR
jgi:hypothetical protein